MSEKKLFHLYTSRKLVAVVLVSLAFAGFAGVETYLLFEYQKRKESYIQEHLNSLTYRINATVHNLEEFSRYVFETKVNNAQVTAILMEAWQSAPANRALFGDNLQTLMKEEYDRLLAYNFRQLHFHFPDTTSFLRMHSPAQFGDKLKDVRITVLKANRDLLPVVGFEEGRIFNGYRFVYPLFHENKHCGSVEVSFSMKAFLEVLGETEECSLRFGIDKEIVETTVFAEEQNNYTESEISPLLLSDIKVHSIGERFDFSKKTQRESEPFLMEKVDFGLESLDNGIRHLHLYKSIRNVSDEPVAWIVMSLHDEGLAIMRRDSLALSLTMTLAWMLTELIILLVFRDRARLALLSHTDRLTGIANRQYLYEQAQIELARADRYGYPVSVILFDIDHFKSFNDSFGHAEGDRVLAGTTKLVSSVVRSTDVFARWGGEEFIVFLPHCTKDDAMNAAEKIRETVEQSEISAYRPVTVSLGVSSYILGDTLDSMINRADNAMYKAKEAGRNCVRC